MSMARREPKWNSRSLSWAGQALLVQRHTASPSAPEGGAAAGRAPVGHRNGCGRRRALGHDDLDEVGDHVARALDEDGVADADVLPPHLVLVVQAHVAIR